MIGPITLALNQHAQFQWELARSTPENNLVRNLDLTLHWMAPNSPDHWRYDDSRKSWVSENIPVTAGSSYFASVERGSNPTTSVELQWMAQHWLATQDPHIAIEVSKPVHIIAPPLAVYVRFVIASQAPPNDSIRRGSLTVDSPAPALIKAK